jgi:predicted aldo/keto reductase-like oxidoreductase
MIIQTKVGAQDDVAAFEAAFERSMSLLQLDHVDLFAFHGINSAVELERALKCYDKALEWKKSGRIRHIGFSTHGSCTDITKAIETGLFEYVNLHYYWIYQENWAAVQAAAARDMGVFIISPNEKGGMLFKATEKFTQCCAPLHPLSFNGLFCLSHPEVHTLSCGIAVPGEFDPQVEMADLLESPEQAATLIAPIEARLNAAMEEALGAEWARTWRDGLPEWQDTPGEVNIPMITRLHNLAVAFDMVEYGKMRYNLLGNGGTWFPGQKADKLETLDLSPCLRDSPNAARIPAILGEAHALLAGEEKKRLQEN